MPSGTASTICTDLTLRLKSSLRRLTLAVVSSSVIWCQCIYMPLFSAERFEVHFEEISIPISIKELVDWSKGQGTESSELASWLKLFGLEDRKGLNKFLMTPLVRDKSMARQLLKSWAGRKLLDEVSDLIRLDEDTTGRRVFNTFESLLKTQNEVNTLDLLTSLPGEVIHFDLDGWLQVAKNWEKELKRQQKLIDDLSLLNSGKKNIFDLGNGINHDELRETQYQLIKVDVAHRKDPLWVQVWSPSNKNPPRSSWIVLMPGLGGAQNHFRWLARSLVHKGWPVIVLQHPGSDLKAVQALLEGSEPVPGAEVIPDRISDLRSIVKAKEEKVINISGDKLVVIGHSLGALTAFIAAGAYPSVDLDQRCVKALENLTLSNLSALLQCQLVDIPLSEEEKINQIDLIVGINSFGSHLWSNTSKAQLNIPVLLTGGTFDLITPAISEQLGLFASIKSHPLSRVLLVEGASHFSPIRVENQKEQKTGDDLFQLGESLVGVHPFSVQSLLADIITMFIDKFENNTSIQAIGNQMRGDLKFHVLNLKIIKNILNSQ